MAAASSAERRHRDRRARLGRPVEPALDVLFRPEEVHPASGEDDVVPPAARPGRGSGREGSRRPGRPSRTSTYELRRRSRRRRPRSGRRHRARRRSRTRPRRSCAYHQRPRASHAERRRHGGERVRHPDLAALVERRVRARRAAGASPRATSLAGGKRRLLGASAPARARRPARRSGSGAEGRPRPRQAILRLSHGPLGCRRHRSFNPVL